jgi:hypothetical protein
LLAITLVKEDKSVADELTDQDWGKIHARAWTDPDFRYKLETDPTAAVKEYGRSVGKTFEKIVRLRPAPEAATRKDIPDTVLKQILEEMNPFPPWCC